MDDEDASAAGTQPTGPTSQQIVEMEDKIDGYWEVEVVDAEGVITKKHLNANEVFADGLPDGLRIMLTSYNGMKLDGGPTLSFLGRYLGPVGRKIDTLPIHFRDWRLVDKSLKQKVWDTYFEPIFCIPEGHRDILYRYLISIVGDRWAKRKRDLFKKYYSDKLTMAQNLASIPHGISPTDWGAYITARTEASALENQKKNKANRSVQILNHGGGSQPYDHIKEKRRAKGLPVSRGDVWIDANSKADGSFRQPEAKAVAD
ncbi:hypothetical protein LINPERPRIM_LOCUS21955 [Linum perenne]